MAKKKFAGNVVVITGASAGVGRCVAELMAMNGASVGLISRNKERLDMVAHAIAMQGGRAVVCPADVADAEALDKAAETIETRLGPIDIWINNAMVSVFSPVSEMTTEEYRRVTEVTYLGVVHGTLSALKRMRLRNRGTIVQVGSALAYRGIPLQSAYCAAKHAVQGFHDSLRTELLHENSKIIVTMVQLPALNTPHFEWVLSRLPKRPQPVPPIYQPTVAAEAIMWAARHRRKEVLVGYPTLLAIWSNRFFSSLVDLYLSGPGGYDSQQTKEPADLARANNLWQSVSGPFGTYGRFGKVAKTKSYELWITTHRLWVAIGTAGVVLLFFLLKSL